jgi:hypothetical protein
LAGGALQADPLGWLLEPDDAAVRHQALLQLLDRPADDPDVATSRRAAMAADPIASILAAQDPDGYWEKPGPGYATKYRGTVWQLSSSISSEPIRWMSASVVPVSTSYRTARPQTAASERRGSPARGRRLRLGSSIA